MIDVHSHILFGVDDGCATIDKSISLIKEELLNGVDKIFLTPHFENNDSSHLEKINKNYQELLTRVEKENLNVSLYLGQEYFVDYDFYQMLNDEKLVTLSNTKYVLVEFAYFDETDILEHILKIKAKGYTPIIAHIERYAYLDWNLLIEFKLAGALMQVNASCIVGEYGKKMKKLALSAIKNGLVNFVASDIHDSRKNYMRKAYDKTAKELGKEIADKVFYKNAETRLVNDNN